MILSGAFSLSIGKTKKTSVFFVFRFAKPLGGGILVFAPSSVGCIALWKLNSIMRCAFSVLVTRDGKYKFIGHSVN